MGQKETIKGNLSKRKINLKGFCFGQQRNKSIFWPFTLEIKKREQTFTKIKKIVSYINDNITVNRFKLLDCVLKAI